MQFLVHSLSFSSVYYYGEVHSLIFECWPVCILVKIMHGPWCAKLDHTSWYHTSFSNSTFRDLMLVPELGNWSWWEIHTTEIHTMRASPTNWGASLPAQHNYYAIYTLLNLVCWCFVHLSQCMREGLLFCFVLLLQYLLVLSSLIKWVENCSFYFLEESV